MSVHSAESALSWYKSLFTKCGVRARGCGGREPDRAILANLLFPAKASAYNAGDLALIPGSGRSPGGREWLPTPVFLPGEFQVQSSLVGYSPWGLKESDTTE